MPRRAEDLAVLVQTPLRSSTSKVLYRDPPGTIQLLGGEGFGHKGAALSLLVELLATILAGDEAADRGRRGNNLAILVIAVDGGFAERADRIGAYVRSSRPMDPGRPVLLPGERERVSRAHARGVAVDDRTWRALTVAAGRHGLPMPPASARWQAGGSPTSRAMWIAPGAGAGPRTKWPETHRRLASCLARYRTTTGSSRGRGSPCGPAGLRPRSHRERP